MSDLNVVCVMKKIFSLFWQAITGAEQTYTSGNINIAIFLLSVPMILEMIMESLFAVVDIYFVSKISVDAVATVGLTESVLTLIYSVAIGISVGATAMVSRRVGEGNNEGASLAIGQVIFLSLAMAVIIGLLSGLFATEILKLMGAGSQIIATGASYTRILFFSTPVIVLLYSLSGALRGAGKAAVAMQSLWIANGINILLVPLFIFGWGPVPPMGVTGAAIATTIGRSSGVLYQLYFLMQSKYALRLHHLLPHRETLKGLFSISSGGMGQFLISSASWIFLIRILAEFGSDVVAGYTIAIRIVIFTILPASGLANAAATLVGQNLGALQPERAEISVWRTGKYNFFLLLVLGFILFTQAEPLIRFFTNEAVVVETGVLALKIISLGYPFFAYGMVIVQSLNGSGDSKTPILINLLCFWMIEIPLAYALAILLNMGPEGVFASVPIAESVMALIAILYFRKGKWKTVKV
jgi:putative MATE family efflux protein